MLKKEVLLFGIGLSLFYGQNMKTELSCEKIYLFGIDFCSVF